MLRLVLALALAATCFAQTRPVIPETYSSTVRPRFKVQSMYALCCYREGWVSGCGTPTIFFESVKGIPVEGCTRPTIPQKVVSKSPAAGGVCIS